MRSVADSGGQHTTGPMPTHTPGKAREPARLRDVARAAGVHVATVSRVVNPRSGAPVRESTRDRVLEEVVRLGYRPNAIARSLKLAETGSLGLLVPSLRNPVLADVIRGAMTRAWERNFVVLLAEDTGEDAAQRAYERLVQEGRIEGLLVASAHLGDRTWRRYLADNVPCVFLNRRYAGSHRNVSMREEDAGRVAATHLIELGHRRLAHIAGPADLDTACRRLAGFVEGAEKVGVAPAIVHASFDERAGFVAMTELLLLKPRPTAIFVSNINQAIGAVVGARRSHVRIPRDLAVVACDDDPIAEFLEVPLTTIRMPLAELGRTAVDALLDQVAGVAPHDIVVPDSPTLIVRESSERARQ